jgi:CRISPR-associated protein Cmr3
MNTLLLHPTDTLFFRDGRPMSGSLSGHGAAWPSPSVLNAALHAALHRAALADVHEHKRGRSSDRASNAERDRKFGSLTTAGPFPVDAMDQWYFPCPADAQKSNSTKVTFYPAAIPGPSSLPKPLSLSVANSEPPTKDKPAPWWSQEAWSAYLNGTPCSNEDHFKTDAHFTDTEHSIGIGISAETGTQNGEQLYSAHSLRLREGWRLGALAEALDKKNGEPSDKRDLIELLFPNSGQRTPVIVGGQQRLCTVERHQTVPLPLPFAPVITGTRVKWVLLTPAIFPAINDHCGGWLPSWIDHSSGQVMLKVGDTSRGEREGREAWRKRVATLPSIPAKLVAAIVGKPLPVTGYAMPNSSDPDRPEGGAKSTHLAVPAGSVYYFEAESEAAAQALAAALNWHGSHTAPTTIQNRRSTLLGEKGFGLGVCAPWQFNNGKQPPS